MKKNILAVIILAATLVNLTLSAMMLFVFVPYVQKANNLITSVLQVVDLELESGAGASESEVNVEDLENVTAISSENVGLKKGSDGKLHYAASVNAVLTLNTAHKDYEGKKDLITKQEDVVKDIIKTCIAKYTLDQVSENYESVKSEIEAEVLKQLQEMFNSKFIYKVTISFIPG